MLETSISVKGLFLNVSIGVLDHEKKNLQTVYIDLKLKADVGKALLSDALVDTIDYSEIVKKIRLLCLHRHFNLIEHLGYYIMQMLFKDYSLWEVDILISKPQAIQSSKTVTFSVSQTRDGFANQQE